LKEDWVVATMCNATALPDEVLRMILAFLPDARSLCRCAAVSRAFYHATKCSNNDNLWKRLADRQWKLCPILESNGNNDTEASSYFLLEFKRRFKLDATIARYIQDMSSVLDSTDLGSDLRRNSYGSVRQDDWKTLNKALID
jgi:F-box-like